jgi:hypothetical protein
VPAVDGDGVRPALVEPGPRPVPRQIVAVQGDVADDAVGVDEHDDIAARRGDPGGGRRIELAQFTEPEGR